LKIFDRQQKAESLRTVSSGCNPLTLELPSLVENWSESLEEFDLSSSEIHGSIRNTIGDLTSLSKLSLWDNNLTGPIPGTLGRLPKIQELYLHDKLQGPIPISLCQVRCIGNLFLSGNRISGSIPSFFGNVTYFENSSIRQQSVVIKHTSGVMQS